MPRAAVPDYLGTDFSQASPGLRFGMYLPIWGQRWEKSNEGNAGNNLWRNITALNKGDQALMKGLADREARLVASLANVETFDAIASAPFVTGLGNEHPLENGFAFLDPYGLPYLPGSGIKGVVRQAARELASGDWGEARGWSSARCHRLPRRHSTTDEGDIRLSMIDLFFGLESQDGEREHMRGVLHFWDAAIRVAGNRLAVEIMTPHQSHYYQKQPAKGSTSPHDSGQPNPIRFLVVPAGSKFAFHVYCDLARLEHLLEHLQPIADVPTILPDDWRTALGAAFEHAFAWLGFGAKTAVGYGAMEHDAKAGEEREKGKREAAEQARYGELSPARKEIFDFERELRVLVAESSGRKSRDFGAAYQKAKALADKARSAADWSADDKSDAARAIEHWLPQVQEIAPKDVRKKLKLGQLRSQ